MSTDADYYTSYGAGVLAKQIETYWHKLGHGGVRVERYALPGLDGTFGVRSNLVNGLPPIEAEAAT